MLEDLGSKNGTQVNGLPITRHLLSFGDKIQVGPNVMLLFAPFDPVEDQLLQRQRLEALGRVGAGVAHDLNNMLGAIGASIDYLGNLPEEPNARAATKFASASTTSGSRQAKPPSSRAAS